MDRADVAQQLLSAPLGLQFLDILSQTNAGSLNSLDLLELVERAQTEISIYDPDYDDRLARLAARRPRLNRWAIWVVDRAKYWWSDLDRSKQSWSGGSSQPGPSAFKVNLDAFSAEVPKPKAALWTSTLVSSGESAWLRSADVNEAPPSYEPHVLWNLTVAKSARIFEVHSPADWRQLVREHGEGMIGYRWSPDGIRSGAQLRKDPDWRAVSHLWDGVHVSWGGLLTSQDAPIAASGLSTELRGWNVESTVWLRWRFTGATALSQPIA